MYCSRSSTKPYGSRHRHLSGNFEPTSLGVSGESNDVLNLISPSLSLSLSLRLLNACLNEVAYTSEHDT